jgi:hypothetical protein
MTLNVTQLREELIKLGAVQRLSDLNKEREVLLKLLGQEESREVKAKEIIKHVKSRKKYKLKKKHWTQTPEGKKKMSQIMLAKYANGWKGKKK